MSWSLHLKQEFIWLHHQLPLIAVSWPAARVRISLTSPVSLMSHSVMMPIIGLFLAITVQSLQVTFCSRPPANLWGCLTNCYRVLPSAHCYLQMYIKMWGTSPENLVAQKHHFGSISDNLTTGSLISLECKKLSSVGKQQKIGPTRVLTRPKSAFVDAYISGDKRWPDWKFEYFATVVSAFWDTV